MFLQLRSPLDARVRTGHDDAVAAVAATAAVAAVAAIAATQTYIIFLSLVVVRPRCILFVGVIPFLVTGIITLLYTNIHKHTRTPLSKI